MNRKSIFVKIARQIQNIPLHPFRIIERAIFLLTNHADKHQNIIILLALPRSGSTLTYQVINHSLNTVYLSNLGNLLYQLPLLGGLLSILTCRNYNSNFQSAHGFVSGLCGPAEGMRFWSYWLGNSLNEYNKLEINPEKMNKRYLYLKRAFSFLGKPKQPITTGYLGHILYTSQLRKIFPKAIFIRLHRNPLDNALSILNSRKEMGQDEWFSVYPKECENEKGKGMHLEVASQVYWLNRRLNETTNTDKLTCHISYEALCKNPKEQVRKIIEFCNSKGMNLHQRNMLPHQFEKNTNDTNKNIDALKLDRALSKMIDNYGKLTESFKV